MLICDKSMKKYPNNQLKTIEIGKRRALFCVFVRTFVEKI